MRFIKDTKIDFLGHRKLGFTVSGTLILAGLLSLLLQGGPNLGIDFEGGTLVQIKFDEPVEVSDLRGALKNSRFENSEIQTFGASDEILIKFQKKDKNISPVEEIKQAITIALPGKQFEFRRVETVGPKIGAELSGQAVMTILTAIIGILIYISIRFEFKYAAGAVIALVHDVVITLGIFSIMNYEISLAIVAAFLTIVGYSLNDTIVIFDRIRENVKRLKRENFVTIINRSVNESLSRTVITSLTTFFVVFILWFSGGEVIRYFAFAMMVGVIIGTYSSIFVASPVVIYLHDRFAAKNK
tara:strand:+ start:24456 stop:25355 length:900 start_codon:yes stop_codon:yes gene_type:complete